MKAHLPGFAAGLLAGLAVAAVAGGQVTSTAKVVLDNERVRVRDVTFPPGETAMHTHELPHVGVVIDGGTLVFKYPDGKTETAKLEAGGAGFREANVTHAPVNTGKTPVRVIEVELK
jgi:mannose-6-phosphate isomerase-like protein (cupin superfamily)